MIQAKHIYCPKCGQKGNIHKVNEDKDLYICTQCEISFTFEPIISLTQHIPSAPLVGNISQPRSPAGVQGIPPRNPAGIEQIPPRNPAGVRNVGRKKKQLHPRNPAGYIVLGGAKIKLPKQQFGFSSSLYNRKTQVTLLKAIAEMQISGLTPSSTLLNLSNSGLEKGTVSVASNITNGED